MSSRDPRDRLGPVPDFDLLLVCTGNVARSPAFEAMLRHGLAAASSGPDMRAILVRSAGTGALVDQDIDAPMRAALERRGLRTGRFAARQLDQDMVAAADLVLTASRQVRSVVVRLCPSSVGKTFTMREFARYCDAFAAAGPQAAAGSPADRLESVLAFARERRGTLVPRRPEDDDVADPHGRSRRRYRQAAESLAEAAASILAVVAR
jgi:protein-tyrosine phosphatase